jgi:hypothetical protein
MLLALKLQLHTKQTEMYCQNGRSLAGMATQPISAKSGVQLKPDIQDCAEPSTDAGLA